MKASMSKQPQKPTPPVNETELSEQDLIVVPGQGRLKKSGFVKHDPDKAEHEGETLKNSLHTIVRVASHLDKELSVRANFPEWVSEKIGAVKSDMVSVMDYIISSKEMQGVTEGTDDVDSLVTDTEAVMRKFKIDALPALKIVLGEREYKDRPGYYNSFIRQIIARSKQQGVAEGSNPEKVEVRFSAKEYAAMSPAQKAAKQEEWQQLKQQAKMRLQNFTLIDTDKEQGVAEGKRNLKCVCKTHGTLQCPVHTPKDIDVLEGAKVDRMVKHVAQSEKKLGHSKKESENIAWATANKRGMLDNKNKKK